MPITNFLNFTTNAVPATGDYLVGFVDDAGNRGQYEYKTTFQTLFDAYGTYASGLSGITPSQLSTGHPMWNVGGDFTVPGQLNANNAIVGSSNISTTNGTIFSKGAANAIIAYDRNSPGTAYASFFKEGGNNYLAGTTSGTVITYTSGGRVGIGTTAPNTTLTVSGSISASNVINAFQGYGTSGPSGAYGYFDRSGNGTAGAIFRQSGVNQLWDDNAGTVVAYTSSGNVGIGTITPNKNLTVVGTISATTEVTAPNTAKAWVNFNGVGTGSMTIRSSFNVSSVVRNAVGDYTINFTTAITNPTMAGSAKFDSGNTAEAINVVHMRRTTNNGTGVSSSIRVSSGYNTSVYVPYDEEVVSVIVFGN